MHARLPKNHVAALEEPLLASLALAYRACNAHLTQASETGTLARRAGIG